MEHTSSVAVLISLGNQVQIGMILMLIANGWKSGVRGWMLHNLGLAYLDLTQQNEALKCFLQALRIRRSVVDHRGEGWTLYNIGMLSLGGENYDLALACFLSADDIFNNIDVVDSAKIQSYIDEIRKEVGEEQFTQVKLCAIQIIEKALSRGGE
jgi:tetratricopeptide (TPR) repeat protein